jgi:ubiquinone/menaquinone biosynthesis C-methylase UbiE
VNIDSRPLPGVDVVRDILRGLPFSDETVDEVYSENFLEHIPQTEVIWVMNEIWRVMKPGGTMHHLIPEAGTTLFFQDPTHTAHWCFETFTYFQQGHRRNEYYGGAIKPWIIESLTRTDPNKLIDVVMRKPQ